MTTPAAPEPLPGADDGPATSARVRAWLGVDADTPAGVAAGDMAAAVNAFIRRFRTEPAAGWDADDVMGATMLAARLTERRHSAAGVLPFGAEGAAYVSRNDPDVALLLRLGPYGELGVG